MKIDLMGLWNGLVQSWFGLRLGRIGQGNTRTIISKLHHYHMESNVAQHEIMNVTTYITNLSLTEHWKGITHQFLSHSKEKLFLLDSLVPDTDKTQKTVKITFLPEGCPKESGPQADPCP